MAQRLLFICLLLLAPVAILAQQGTNYHIQQLGTEDGLPSNGTKGLQWDSKTGFLWIATEAGMVRFNGVSFKIYTNEDNSQITNERVLFLVRNNAGTIFTADNTGNIFYVQKNSLSFLKKAVITGNSRSNIFTLPVSDRFYNANHEKIIGPFALQFDKVLPANDTACFILHAGTLYHFTLSMQSPQPVSLPGASFSSAFISEKDIFLVDRTGNIQQLDKATFRLSAAKISFDNAAHRPVIKESLFIWENGMDHPVLINRNNAWILRFKNGVLNAESICSSIPVDVLIRYAQYDESAKTLFLGTDSKGIIIIRKNKVEPMRKERKSANERTSYYSQVELPDGNVMTNEGHILGKNKPELAKPLFNGAFSISSYMMGDSLFWFIKPSARPGISCLHSYNFKTGQLTPFYKIRENFSQLVMTISGGHKYLVSESGIYRMDGDSLIQVYKYLQPDRLRTHFDMKEISPGVLAIANCNALLRYDIAANKLDTLFDPGNYCVRTIWTYKDYIFFGTYGNGLFISKNGKVKPLPLDKNRYLLFTHCFVDDGNGFCWISTNRGLFKASIDEMINAYETGARQVYYHYFGRRDGMDMTEMNGGCAPCALLLKNKTISFPTMEGLLWVDPVTATPVLPDGEIFVDEVLVDNKRMVLPALEEKPLSASRHDILIRIGFSAWCNKENIYLEYRMNDDTEWKPINIENGASIQLNNLGKGDYVLHIRKLNGFGVNNYSYKEIRFSIPAPWHQRWWFFALCALVLIGIIAVFLRLRTRQYKIRQRKLEKQVDQKTRELLEQNEILEKNNTIKTRLISIISHDIVTPLKFLTVAGKNLLEKRKLMPEELQQETIQEMANTSQELQFLSTNILNWIKYQNENRRLSKENINVHEVVNQVLGILNSAGKQKKLLLRNEVDPVMEIRQYFEPLKILIYNLLTNAIHFSEKGTIVIGGTTEETATVITVTDEGVGMTPEQIQNIMADQFIISSANIDKRKGNGLGYLIIKDLLKMMGATLSITSEKGKGTIVSINIPDSAGK
ncbi:MAG: HAMP domain-containing histidine kinase [Chitinophagaceae bacterium]|nr:HAMP domain-containing histidine kinase [Chitinophagaceae bacterium]